MTVWRCPWRPKVVQNNINITHNNESDERRTLPDASLLNDEEKGAESNGSLWRRRTDLALLRPIVGIGDLGDFGEVFPSSSAESNVLCVGVIRMVTSKDKPHRLHVHQLL